MPPIQCTDKKDEYERCLDKKKLDADLKFIDDV